MKPRVDSSPSEPTARESNGGATRIYPIALNLRGVCVLAVGGGRIAERKVRSLLFAGARVVLVAPSLTPGLEALAQAHPLTIRRRAYRTRDLSRAIRLCFAATDNRAVNARVARDARSRRVWVNVADDARTCEFHVPAVLRRRGTTIAISTGGRSPARAKALRDRLAQQKWI